MSGMTRKTRVVHGFDLGLAAEKLGHALRVFGMSPDAVGKRLQAAQRQPALKRRRHRAALALHGPGFFEQGSGFAEYERTAQDVTVAGEILGYGVHDHVGAEFQWLLQQRRGPGVV